MLLYLITEEMNNLKSDNNIETKSDLIIYKDAWLYPTSTGWEASYYGCHYDAKTLPELKQKIDIAIRTNDPERLLSLYSQPPVRTHVTMNEDITEEVETEWVVLFQLTADETDDSFESTNEEISLTAPDIETAVKYAQQYIRKQSIENDRWKEAEILSIQMR